jgi:Glycosyl transferase family 2
MDFGWPGFVGLSRAEEALVCGDGPRLCAELTALFPKDPVKRRVERFVRFALQDSPPPRVRAATIRPFVDSMTVIKRMLSQGRGRVSLRQNRRIIGRDLDFIAEDYGGGAECWSIPKCLNYLLMNRLCPTRRAAVVTAMRDDGIYILEFIAYYLALGFEHIFIYTNDNADGSEVLLRLLADHNVITLIESETEGTVLPTMKAYEHAIHLLHDLREFAWVLFVDSDEYFYAPPRFHHSVINLLAALQERYQDRLPSAICFHWLWFVSGSVYARRPGLLIERFQHALPHTHTKALVRLHDLLSMRHIHYPELRASGFFVDSAFDPLPPNLQEVWAMRGPQYSGGRINHYWTRSFEEFAIKVARAQSLKLELNVYDRPFQSFFGWNRKETPDNHHPIEAQLLKRVKQKLVELEALEAVLPIAREIERNLPSYLDRHYENPSLRTLYEIASTDQQPLEPEQI